MHYPYTPTPEKPTISLEEFNESPDQKSTDQFEDGKYPDYDGMNYLHKANSFSDKVSRKQSVLQQQKKVDSFDQISELKNYKQHTHKQPGSEQALLRPEFKHKKGDDKFNAKLWELMSSYLGHERWFIQKQIVNHIEYTVVKSRFNFDNSHLSAAVASSLRDRLIECFNDTNQHYAENNPKRVYYLSAEYLQGRMMQNILVNLNLIGQYTDSLMDIGYQLEDLYEYECDLGLGNGGLGRLAACFLDSMATLEIPAWSYGIRYHYGNFKQHIVEVTGKQIEVPNFGYSKRIPWEIQRNDVLYPVQFYGEVKTEIVEINGLRAEKVTWGKAEVVKAMAYDTPVLGYNTFNTNCLRLWSALPSFEHTNKEYHCHTDDDYINLVKARQRAERITSVLYSKDKCLKELEEDIIRQQYFFCAATIKDIVRRFQKNHPKNFELFSEKIAIQLNDAHPAIAIIELMRILIDEIGLTLHQSWLIACKTFSYTSHSTGNEFLEKWSVDLVAKILPRHLQIIHYINYFFIDKIKKQFPNDKGKIARMSIVEMSNQGSSSIRMAYICFLASHKVNGVSMEHTNILRQLIFRDFNEMFPSRIISITNGVSQRRWIQCANPSLAKLITKCLGDEEWLINLNLLQQLNAWKFDKQFIQEFLQIRKENKHKLIDFLKRTEKNKEILNDFLEGFLQGNEEILIDVMAKKIFTSKRQILYIFYIILRYLRIKENPKSQGKIGKVIYLLSGRASFDNLDGKKTIEFIHKVMNIINNDSAVTNYMKVIFVPNFTVATCEKLVSAADISQQISTPGTEPSGTSNMKFIMNGGVIVGSRDGANLEIEKELGQQNIFLFGSDKTKLFAYQKFLRQKPQGLTHIDISLRKVFDFCLENRKEGFEFVCDQIQELENLNDKHGICLDFVSYTQAMDEAYKTYFTSNRQLQTSSSNGSQNSIASRTQSLDSSDWVIRQINCIANSGKFSSDRTISEYCDDVWNVTDLSIPKGAQTPVQRIRSSPNVSNEDKLREKMNTTNAPMSFIKT